MTNEEIAEDYIIQRYGINKNYRVDDEKTRSYMKIFVHSDYQQEYECYLAGLIEGWDKGYKKAAERAYERQQDLTDTFIRDGETIKRLEKEIERLKQIVQENNKNLQEEDYTNIISKEQLEFERNFIRALFTHANEN